MPHHVKNSCKNFASQKNSIEKRHRRAGFHKPNGNLFNGVLKNAFNVLLNDVASNKTQSRSACTYIHRQINDSTIFKHTIQTHREKATKELFMLNEVIN